MVTRQVLLLSNSKLHGQECFEWCADFLSAFLLKNQVTKLLFIPYAVRDYDDYLNKVEGPFNKLGFQVESIHNKSDPVVAVSEAQAIFVGGGNTFLLLKTLYENNLIEPIRTAILKNNTPYIGSSAGTNVGTRSINTTNDMPICYPPSLEALKLIPFNINPHYIEADPNSNHMGETREQRIKEYLNEPGSAPVLGLKEGTALLIENDKATLMGHQTAKVFENHKMRHQNSYDAKLHWEFNFAESTLSQMGTLISKDPVEYKSGDDLSFLLSFDL